MAYPEQADVETMGEDQALPPRPNLAQELDRLDYAIEQLQKAVHTMVDRVAPLLGPDFNIRSVDSQPEEDKASTIIESIRMRKLIIQNMTELLHTTNERIEL